MYNKLKPLEEKGENSKKGPDESPGNITEKEKINTKNDSKIDREIESGCENSTKRTKVKDTL